MTQAEQNLSPHRRQNLLNGEWVLVSPHRATRPWQGQQETISTQARPSYDESCYLCPGNTRVGGYTNPDYGDTFVFTNDFPALKHGPGFQPADDENDLFKTQSVNGTCRVLCFSPRHDQTLSELSNIEVKRVIETWQREAVELGAQYQWVQIFENKGEVMGCSNPHPHGQIWAMDTLPNEARKEDEQQRIYFEEKSRHLLMDVAHREMALERRVVLHNEHWLVVVPHWALWPFETLLLPLEPIAHFHQLTSLQTDSLADILGRLSRRYDNLFGVPFPYSMGWHGAPFRGAASSTSSVAQGGETSRANEPFVLHAHFYPPLLRSATVRKFMVGFEMLGEGQRDLTPEQAAARLRACSEEPLTTSLPAEEHSLVGSESSVNHGAP